MTPVEFLFVALGLAALAILASGLLGSSPPSEEEDAEETTRWLRFRLDGAACEAGEPGVEFLRQEPRGLRLQLLAPWREESGLRAGRVEGEKSREIVEVRRRWLRRRELALRFERRPWLRLVPRNRDEFPRLQRASRAVVRVVPEARGIALSGSLSEREYEVRLDGRLVVSVSRQEEEESTAEAAAGYWVEIVKSAPVRPLLALVLALEHWARARGLPGPVLRAEQEADGGSQEKPDEGEHEAEEESEPATSPS